MRHIVIGAVFLGASLVNQSAPAQTPEPEAVLVEGPGREATEFMCGQCHSAAARIAKQRKTAAEWADVIKEMQGFGLEAEEKDIQVVLAYLTKFYAPPPK